jgi:hypothetical protein
MAAISIRVSIQLILLALVQMVCNFFKKNQYFVCLERAAPETACNFLERINF